MREHLEPPPQPFFLPVILLSASTFPLSAARPSSAVAHNPPPTPCTRLAASVHLGTCLLLPHKHPPIRERIHTCPGQLLRQHQVARGMCGVPLHLRLPLGLFRTVGFKGAAEQKDERCSGGEKRFSLLSDSPRHNGPALCLSACARCTWLSVVNEDAWSWFLWRLLRCSPRVSSVWGGKGGATGQSHLTGCFTGNLMFFNTNSRKNKWISVNIDLRLLFDSHLQRHICL